MQIVYRTDSREDAEDARGVLVSLGIAAHIPNEPVVAAPAGTGARPLRVMVDNSQLDQARRAIEGWQRKSV